MEICFHTSESAYRQFLLNKANSTRRRTNIDVTQLWRQNRTLDVSAIRPYEPRTPNLPFRGGGGIEFVPFAPFCAAAADAEATCM